MLLLRPAAFGSNPETAPTNAFQECTQRDARELLARGQAEFDGLAAALASAGVEVQVVADTPTPPKPDAVFPNNWVSFHADGTAVLYPMLAPSRQAEVRLEVLAELRARGLAVAERVLDLRAQAGPEEFLEGTGSLVLDRPGRRAFACLSPRTSARLLACFGAALGYRTIAFRAFDARGVAIYHTNVMMALGTRVAVACLEAIRDPDERSSVGEALRRGRELVELDLAQIDDFAANLLELRTREGGTIFVLSERAQAALRPSQRAALERHGRLVSADLATIETCGGGSARCMLAELF